MSCRRVSHPVYSRHSRLGLTSSEQSCLNRAFIKLSLVISSTSVPALGTWETNTEETSVKRPSVKVETERLGSAFMGT